jgi:hypothetical protein
MEPNSTNTILSTLRKSMDMLGVIECHLCQLNDGLSQPPPVTATEGVPAEDFNRVEPMVRSLAKRLNWIDQQMTQAMFTLGVEFKDPSPAPAPEPQYPKPQGPMGQIRFR